jgi:hypothetical protein
MLGSANSKGYFAMRYSDGGNRYRLYELSSGSSTLNHVTPSGTWQGVGSMHTLGGKAYVTLRDLTPSQHIYESSGGAWTENSPTGTFNGGEIQGVFDGKLFAGLQDQSTGEYQMWQLSGGTWSNITPNDSPNGLWGQASMLGEANGKGYFAMRYSDGGNRYRLYELSSGSSSLSHITPSGTWQSLSGLYELGGKVSVYGLQCTSG